MTGARQRADAERLERAREFARLVGTPVQRWMRWSGWVLLVGCDVCGDQGPRAGCWARMGCHGWSNGCGCIACAVRQARELERLERRGGSPRTAETRGEEDGVHHHDVGGRA